ncbi:MAG: hypothetical protein JNL67_22385 [Planctomycetaceae bacterium]|nr:hypothetical protein [Planctomycetaceae bacterium]
MEQLQQLEWNELRSRTWSLLRQRDHILRSKHTPLFQYLVRPSFADTWCIDIVQTGDVIGVYHTTWRLTHDLEAFSTAIERLKYPRPYDPTLESMQFDPKLLDIDSVLKRISKIRLPLKLTENRISLDGTSFEMQIGNGTNGILLQWQNQLPDEWRELSEIVESLNELASRFIKTVSKPVWL